VSATTIAVRLAKGFDPEDAIATPPQNTGARDVMFTKLTAFGQTKGIMDWSRDRRSKVTVSGIRHRLRSGWSLEDALTVAPFQRPRDRRR
jgi:hypothetical protein